MDAMFARDRSRLMARICWDSLRPESAMAEALSSAGLGWADRNCRDLPGSPDFAFPGVCVAVFVHGCFWHRCRRHFRLPKTRTAFWAAKMEANCRRDARVRRTLNRAGWSVLVVWKHDLRHVDGPYIAAKRVARAVSAKMSARTVP